MALRLRYLAMRLPNVALFVGLPIRTLGLAAGMLAAPAVCLHRFGFQRDNRGTLQSAGPGISLCRSSQALDEQLARSISGDPRHYALTSGAMRFV